MKKVLLIVSVLLALNLLGGCSKPQEEDPITPESSVSSTESATTPSDETDSADTTSPTLSENDGDAASDPADEVYAQQIERYYTAISEQWDEGAYFEHEMSAMAAYYYEGNALDNAGFTLMDLNGDDVQELIIGAIRNAEQDPLVFEIWAIKDGEPVMLAQSGSRNRYYM